MRAPRLSVLMPTRNAAAFVGEAISSVLASSHADFELLVVDDASSDTTHDVIGSFSDPRLRVILRSEPSNDVAIVLNQAIANSSGELLARMDADDVCLPTRLARQCALLDREPRVGVVGTWATVVDASGRPRFDLMPPSEDVAIRFVMRYRCPLVHPSVMMRRSVVESVGGYREGTRHVEDYDLWRRLLPSTQFANVAEPLMRYRTHDASSSHAHHVAQQQASLAISEVLIKEALAHEADPAAVMALRNGTRDNPEGLVAAIELIASLASHDLGLAVTHHDKAVIRRTAAHEVLTASEGTPRRLRSRAITAAFRLSPPQTARFVASRLRR